MLNKRFFINPSFKFNKFRQSNNQPTTLEISYIMFISKKRTYFTYILFYIKRKKMNTKTIMECSWPCSDLSVYQKSCCVLLWHAAYNLKLTSILYNKLYSRYFKKSSLGIKTNTLYHRLHHYVNWFLDRGIGR